jgi:hypothetical protein
MSSNGIEVVYALLTNESSQVVILAIGAALAIFAAYRAFALGRALVVPSYRMRALWFGVLDVSIVVYIALYLASAVFSIVPFWLNDVITTLLGVIFFVWIDRTIEVTLGQDYFHRNTLRWRQLRKLFLVGAGVTLIESGIAYAFTSSAYSPLYLASIVLYTLTLGYAGAVLTVGAFRTTDIATKTHLRWIALTLVAIILANFLPYALSVTIVDVITYFFYRASRSLYLMGHLPGR